MARLFVAVWPPDDVAAAVASLPRPEVDGVRWTPPAQWHVTLRFLGAVDDAHVTAIGRTLAETALPPATAVLGPVVDRFGDRVLHVPVAGLDHLAAAVRGAVDRFADQAQLDDRPFHGHLTVARTASRRPRVRLAPLAGAEIAASWSVGAVVVVRSHVGRSGSRYETVAEVPVDT